MTVLFWITILSYWVYDEFEWQVNAALGGDLSQLRHISWGELSVRELKEILLVPTTWLIYLAALLIGAVIGMVTYLVRRTAK